MIILPSKEKFILEKFIEFSFDSEDEEHLPDFNDFQKFNSTDQFYLAQYYNWDDGVEVLRWIIESTKCDKGTASLIFWQSEPDYFFEISADEVEEYEKDTFLLLKRIVEKFNNKEFTRSIIRYDPADRVKTIDWSKQNPEWNIPNELKLPTQGFPIISMGIIQEKIAEWQRKRKEAERERKRKRRRANGA